jgi:nicotinamide mononucleotide transporter
MIKKYFEDWSMFEKCWLIMSIMSLIVVSYLWKSQWYGFVASITGMVCVVLVAKGRISNYYWGIVNVLFYSYVAYEWKLYGEVMLNMLYFLPMQFVGLYLWSKRDNINEDGKREVTVKFMSNTNRILVALLCAISICLYALFLKYLKGNIPWVDSTSTVLSVIAMILMARRFMEQWILWIIVDVVSILMWFIVVFKQGSNDIGVLIMWTAFLINAIYGFVNWIKLYNKQEVLCHA